MDEHVESGSILEEPGESDSGTSLASGTDLNSPSPDSLRQPASQSRSTLQPGLSELESQIEEAVQRKFQGIKDQRLRRLEDELEFLKKLVTSQEGTARADAPAAPSQQTPERPAARASHVIQPSGGGLPPAPDLRADYEKRVGALRPGDVSGLLELKRQFRKQGLEVY